MSDSESAATLMRESYAKERHHLFVRILAVGFVCLSASVGLNVYRFLKPPVVYYFPTNDDGTLARMAALDNPLVSDAELGSWFVSTLIHSFSFNFSNYRMVFSDARSDYTDAGWNKFQKVLEDSQILKVAQQNQNVVAIAPVSTPEILARGIVNGSVYAWRIRVPVAVTFHVATASAGTTQNFTVETVIVRQPQTEHPQGLGIQDIVFQ